MLISFTGAQSTGKSTLLNAMKQDEQFKDFKFEAEITRSLKEKYNLTINENGDEFTQLITVHSHVDNYLRYRSIDVNAVLDRCIYDGFIYSVYQYFTAKNIDDNVMHYVSHLFDRLHDKYDVIFYTEPQDAPLTDDGVRSVNTKFRDKIIELYEGLMVEHPNNKIVRLKGTVEERMAIIKSTISNLQTIKQSTVEAQTFTNAITG